MGDTSADNNSASIFSGGLQTFFDDLTQIKLAEAYNNVRPPAGYAIGPNGQLVAQATQTPVTASGAPAAPGGMSWMVVIGIGLVAVVVLAYALKG